MQPIAACFPTQIKNRRRREPLAVPEELKTFCQKHRLPYPVTTDYPVRFEILPTAQRRCHGVRDFTHCRNFPSRTYTLFLDHLEPEVIIELLAYYAHEWEAQEVAKAVRSRQEPRKETGDSTAR